MMRKYSTCLFILFFCCFQLNSTFATVYRSISSGDWKDADKWEGGPGVPSTANDTVIIDGHSMTINNVMGNITIKKLIITNASNIGYTALNMVEDVELTVLEEVWVESVREWESIAFNISNNAKLFAQQDFTLIRTVDNNLFTSLQLSMLNYAQLHVAGNFTYDYGNAGSISIISEIKLDNSALINITGDAIFYARGGNDFNIYMASTSQFLVGQNLHMTHTGGDEMKIQSVGKSLFRVDGNAYLENAGGGESTGLLTGPDGGQIVINGDLDLKSSLANMEVLLEASGDSSRIEVLGNITLDALSPGDVLINLNMNGSLSIGGNFERVDNSGQFGSLKMDNGGQLVYNGTEPQIIACDTLPNSGGDSFSGDNVKLDNPSGFVLEGPVIVYDSLVLTDGIISTDSSKTITFAEGAIVKGGSESAFINGPITKEGTTNGRSFVFPTGDIDVVSGVVKYMPIEISALGSPLDQYTAEYVGCPPPYINSVDTIIDHISSEEFWNLTRTDATVTDVVITLHWTDAAASGIDDPSSLVVASFDPVDESWSSIGNGGVVVNGTSGTLQSDVGCPPPYINRFAFASTLPTTNSLPVELLRFTAQKMQSDEVKVEWLTTNEVNADYFTVERSINGRDFEKIGRIEAAGNSEATHYYTLTDRNPGYGQNYYRLMQVDQDGDYNFSRIINVNFTLVIGEPIIYPNPVSDRIHIEGNSPLETEAHIELYNQSGQLIYQANHAMYNGNLSMNTAATNLIHSGHYFLKISTQSGSHTLPLLKID